MSKITIQISDDHSEITISDNINRATLERVIDDLIVPALLASGFPELTLADYIASKYLPETGDSDVSA